MRTIRSSIAALTLALAAVSCSEDKGPTAPAVGGEQQAPTAPKVKQQLFFEGQQTFAGQPALISTVQVTKFNYTQTGGLTIDGQIVFRNAATGAVVGHQNFTGWAATLTKGAGAPTAPTCQILDLDIGAVHLDLLGLVVDLAPVHLDITAQTGPGNLLGNLLCALVGILDPGPGNITAITALLAQINALLSQILTILG